MLMSQVSSTDSGPGMGVLYSPSLEVARKSTDPKRDSLFSFSSRVVPDYEVKINKL